MTDVFLKRQPRITVQQVDDATVLVAVLFQAFPHDDIGLMRVDADVAHLALAIVQKRVQNAM